MGIMNKVNQIDENFSYLSADNKVSLLRYGDSRFDDERFHNKISTRALLNVFWTLNVSRTASYEITLVRLSVRLSVRPCVTKFSQD